ncbi:MAG: anti-sigma factor family protein [bacterium]
MSCFNEEQIQQYLDHEYSKQESESIRQHLEGCRSCQDAFIQQRQRMMEVKQSLDLLVTQHPNIPRFKTPERTVTYRKIPVKHLLPLAIAAGILLLLLLRPLSDSNKPPTNGQNLQFVVSEELDANKPVTEQPLIMTVVAPDGTVSQTTLN